MIRIMKESYGPLRVIEGETFALIRPLFWGKKGVDTVSVLYRVYTPTGIGACETPSPRLVAVAEEMRLRVAERLVGKPQREMTLWVETVEVDEKRD